MRLLLLSNSTQFGHEMLDHAEDAVRVHLQDVRRIVFVPFALADHDAYTAKVRERLERLGHEVVGVHETGDPLGAVASAQAVYIGGGNTFRLLRDLQDTGLLTAIRDRVREGLPYMGASAGTNMACPTIRTTNDMPIVEPKSFEAMGLIPFQINPHYLDPDPTSLHMGETRETRLREYLEENETPVLGLREGSWIEVNGSTITLCGARNARWFRRDADPEEIAPGSDLAGWVA